ncbi:MULTISPECIES: hypothetical protein [Roseomonadaceae]|uniref:Right-handed parallel beta-helix repeat-containing protein n=1 Tax=Falsiroseomonas oleicola TaxID=2801474 RepID=A0ABS6HHY4_9PROT|nr:hypothetical protein [Roseomonas oleicola]MBU8547283.1 hypothetical protein [Roseomonas oleicola]
MIRRRAALGLFASTLATPGLSQRLQGVRLAEFGGQADGTNASEAFARGLAGAAMRGTDLLLGAGTTVIAVPPGEVADARDHDCPEVRHAILRIRGEGAGRTRLLCVPRPTPPNPGLPVSRPILKSVGAVEFSLRGVTLDGGISQGRRGLRQGPDPHAAALLEVRGARHCVLRDVVLTGFAGHWDNRAPIRGAYGRRGPLLVADCQDVELHDLALQHPTFREGLFVHDARRLLVRGFRLRGPTEAGQGGVSSPLNVMGLQTREVLIEDFATEGAWSGSLMNLGGPGHFTIRRLRAQGRPPRRSEDDGASDFHGKGIDIGAEINDSMFPGQAATEHLLLEDVVLEDMAVYAIRATRRAVCPLRRLTLGAGVVVIGGPEALGASHVATIEGQVVGRGMGRAAGTRRRRPAVSINASGGALRLELSASGPDPLRIPDLGVLRLASSGLVLSGRIEGFPRGALQDDVPTAANDLRWDARCRDLDIRAAPGSTRPAIVAGRDEDRRLRSVEMHNCLLDGQALHRGMAGLVLHAGKVML